MEKMSFGKVPIFIFSMNDNHGDYVSLLMSKHLKAIGQKLSDERQISLQENYFKNEPISQLIQSLDVKEFTKEIETKFKLLLDEGLDTNKLYGLSLPISFFGYCIQLIDNFQGFCIFIYNEFELNQSESDLSECIKFASMGDDRCFILDAKFLVSNPQLFLNELKPFLNAELFDDQNILPFITNQNIKFNIDQANPLSNKGLEFFKKNDSIRKTNLWLDGKDLVFIFSIVSIQQEKVILEKLKDIYFSGLTGFHIILHFEDLTINNHFKSIFQNGEYSSFNIDYFLIHISFATWLNKMIQSSMFEYYFIDDLMVNFSLMPFLPRGNSSKDGIKFTKISERSFIQMATLSDVLIKDHPNHNLLFSKKQWLAIGGFDEKLDRQFLFWDFAIQSLHHYRDDAFVIPSSFEHILNDQMNSISAEIYHSGYKKVLMKHEPIIAECLNSIVEIAAEEQQVSQQENKRLFEKISQLQMIAMHAKDELKSLHHLTSQLQQRIQYLENNWYQKLRVKISRVKKIFFKKKSPGGGNLKRILQFVRFAMSKAGFGIVRKIIANILRKLFLMFEKRPVEIIYKDIISSNGIFTYNDWVKKKLNKEAIQYDYEKYDTKLELKPKISIIMPVYNAPIKFLKEAIESVIGQVYTNWELCIADDCSTHAKVRKLLHVYSVKDARIKVHYRSVNGHISATSNDALSLATGEYVLLMDHDDEISKNCLWEIVKSIDTNPKAEIIYSDEDKIDENHFHKDAHFKPDWAPDHLLSRNYLGHVTVLKKSLIDKIGGFRLGFEGSQDYDLMLRATEQTSEIVHIPKVLYHWRIHELSAAQGEDVKPYAYIAAKKALDEALVRRGLKGNVKYLSGLRGYKIEYDLVKSDLISIIIPTKDQTALLKNTIDSIIEITAYKNYEIIVLNNNSTSQEFYHWVDEYTKKYASILKVVDAHFQFNFSKLMNIGSDIAKGEHLLLLNNDVEIIHADWLEIMLSYSQQQRIGAVGARLLYPDDTIQHAGVIIGLGGIAGHSFVGAHKEEAGYFNYIQSVNNYSAVTAACLMCRKEVFKKVGGMDEIFEVEYNDVDFCLKLVDAGYNNVYLPQVELYHYESATRGHPHQSKPSYERHLKEMKLFKEKWQKYIDHDPFYNPNLNLGVHDFSMNFSS